LGWGGAQDDWQVPGPSAEPVQLAPDAQSASVVHIVLQALAEASQANGAQLAGEALHCPALQVEVLRVIASVQLVAAQEVPSLYMAQFPAPSQTPVVPQLAVPVFMQTAAGSVPPTAMGEQVPLPLSAQDLQLPQGPLLQQTPSVQKLLRHSVPATQLVPGGFKLVQEPDWQVYPLPVQSLVLPHMVRQMPDPQV
jgi:hypothetical protein